uniref:PPM-type phosphatase domain-containing protein n=1 Tax=Lotharella globosa TaxID=91324 RepID=A0A7S3YEE3_9EUKA
MRNAYKRVEAEFLKMARQNDDSAIKQLSYGGSGRTPGGWIDGTTACVAVLAGRDLVIGNVGDSRAVLGREKDCIRLSTDHKPELPKERKMIEEAGGKLVFSGCWRVDHPSLACRLACSRSIGDRKFKEVGVISAEPDVRTFKLTPDDRFILIARYFCEIE